MDDGGVFIGCLAIALRHPLLWSGWTPRVKEARRGESRMSDLGERETGTPPLLQKPFLSRGAEFSSIWRRPTRPTIERSCPPAEALTLLSRAPEQWVVGFLVARNKLEFGEFMTQERVFSARNVSDQRAEDHRCVARWIFDLLFRMPCRNGLK
jgi:hypothetical protein